MIKQNKMAFVKLNLCGQILRVGLIIFNMLFAVLGIALIIVGSILVSTGNSLEFLTGSVIVGGAAIIIIAGIVTVLISSCGVLGAIFLSKILLGFYLVTVVLIIILEIIAGSIGLAYRHRIEGTVSKLAIRAMEDYSHNKTSAISAIDTIQAQFSCCGWNSSADWENSTIPNSCKCNAFDLFCDKNTLLWMDGCKDGIIEFAKDSVFTLALVGLAFAIIEVIALVMLIGLCVCIRKHEDVYYTMT